MDKVSTVISLIAKELLELAELSNVVRRLHFHFVASKVRSHQATS